jgi:3'(2'), 5'-bisphosphate nucleotidase
MIDRALPDDDLAAALATTAGRLLLEVRRELAGAEASNRKAAGDRRSHDFLMSALAETRPVDAVLSEEGADDRARLSAETGMDH